MATNRNPSSFHKLNVVDTCAVWNILASRLLLTTAYSAGCSFCCTEFVYYECLYKQRGNPTPKSTKLQNRLKQEKQNGKFKKCQLDIEDLLDVELLQKRKNLGIGELSSIAYSKKTFQAFLTDDQGARNLAERIISHQMVQTTAHLLGWLFFINYLNDGDLQKIIDQHESFDGNLGQYFIDMYKRALDYRSKQCISSNCI
jgi:hypothetical protein